MVPKHKGPKEKDPKRGTVDAEKEEVPEPPAAEKWAIPKFTKDDNPHGLLEESSFCILFPKYREIYLQEVWPVIEKKLGDCGIKGELNLVEGKITVKTTRKTWDPYIIMKARDLIKLLARSVPATQALKILKDDVYCDIIKISGFTRSAEKFKKRRQRLIGPSGSTLKALELLTECYILVQGNTVAALGPMKGLSEVRRVAEECMQNKHPIYHIKAMMIKRELAKNPDMQNEDWSRFLPKFKKKNIPKKKKPKKKKKPYTPFPPPQQPRKVDLQLESGEYFLNQREKMVGKRREKMMKMTEKSIENQKKKLLDYIPTKEPDIASKKESDNVQALASSLRSKGNQGLSDRKQSALESASAFLASDAQGLLKHRKHPKDLNAPVTPHQSDTPSESIPSSKKRKHEGEGSSRMAARKEGKRKHSNHGHGR